MMDSLPPNLAAPNQQKRGFILSQTMKHVLQTTEHVDGCRCDYSVHGGRGGELLPSPCKLRWATLHYQNGTFTPSVTDNPMLRYTWDSAYAAEQQRPLYEQALNLSFTVQRL